MKAVRGLNPAQQQAVRHDRGPLLVVAGAGTGKTAVITLRIANLILEKRVPQQQILALTFTDKAASEMQERVDLLLPYGFVDSSILTFHSLGDRILREYSLELGISSDFTVMSNFQQAILLQELLESTSNLKLKHYRPLGNPYRFVSALLRFISRLKDEAISAEAFAEFVGLRRKQKLVDRDEASRLQEISRIYTAYQEHSRRLGCLDYGDQILLPVELLRAHPIILAELQAKFRYILVDEFQDTNYAQFELLKLLSGKHRNLMVVGDDDQSIYRFRGAAISNILSFLEDFEDSARVVLKQNYRSSQKILDDSYRLIKHNDPYRLEKKHKIDKRLTAKRAGRKPLYRVFDSQPLEMDFVAKSILGLVKKGYQYRDIAILLRKNNQSKAVGASLEKHNVPYVLTENSKLLEQAEIRALLHFINSLNDPQDSQALYGLLSSDIYQMPLEKMVSLTSEAHKSHLSLEEYMTSAEGLAGEASEVLESLSLYRKIANEMSSGELLYDFLQHSGYLKRLVESAKADSNAARKIQNISQFFELVRDFEKVSDNPNIVSLWRHLAKIQSSGEDIVTQTSPLDLDAVRVLTVHRAKGLEFRAVFVVDAVEQTFPATKRAEAIRLPLGLLDGEDEDIPWHIMDERRLFYVAMTRSKDWLCVTASYDHGGKRLKKPTRFIGEASSQQPGLAPVSNQPYGLDNIENFAKLPEPDFDPVARLYSADGWLHLSTNQIADYIRSPKEFWYFHVLRLPKGPFHALVYGSAIHAAIERYYTAKLLSQPVSKKNLLETFEKAWASEGFVSLKHEEDRFDQGRATLEAFYVDQQKANFYPEFIEKPFSLRVPEFKLLISGRYDAVYENSGEIEIRDFKTSQIESEKQAQRRLKDSVQMAIYALAWAKNHKQAVNKISLHFVESNIIACSPPLSDEKILNILKKVTDGIANRAFTQAGQSQINFERLV